MRRSRYAAVVAAALALGLTAGAAPATAGISGDGYQSIPVRYAELGGAGGVLGRALTPELPTPQRPGSFVHYEHGSLYWSPGIGAAQIGGAIRDRWAAMGWENSLLGFPAQHEYPLVRGAFSSFENGSI